MGGEYTTLARWWTYFSFLLTSSPQIGVPYHDKLREKNLGIDRSRGVRSPRAQEHCLTPSGCKVIAFWKVSSDIGFSCKTIITNRRESFKVRTLGDPLLTLFFEIEYFVEISSFLAFFRDLFWVLDYLIDIQPLGWKFLVLSEALLRNSRIRDNLLQNLNFVFALKVLQLVLYGVVRSYFRTFRIWSWNTRIRSPSAV